MERAGLRFPRENFPSALDRAPVRYVDNPNGSEHSIAALCSTGGNVLGLMPHPERNVSRVQHPRRCSGRPAGLAFFENVIRYSRHAL